MPTFSELGIDIKYRAGNPKTKCPFPGCETRTHKDDKSLSVKLELGEHGWQGPYTCHYCSASGFATERPQTKPMSVKKDYQRPEERITNLSAKTIAWFDQRGIQETTLSYFKIGEDTVWMPSKQNGDRGYEAGNHTAIVFPYYRGGKLVNIKYRAALKNFRLHKDAELIFFGLDGVKSREDVVICEGELDCLALYEAGITNAISVPNGASRGTLQLDYVDNCWEQLKDKKSFTICTDDDEPGRKLRDELVRRLGKERCLLVTYPEGCKDSNEVLLRYDGDTLRNMVRSAQPLPISAIYGAEELEQEMDIYFRDGFPEGIKLGWPEFDKLIRFRAGQLVILTGHANSGKSTWWDQVMIKLGQKAGWKWAVFSFEQQPSALHAMMLAQQIVGMPIGGGGTRMNQWQYEQAKAFIRDHFVFVKLDEADLSIDGILEKGRELVQQRGINGILVDPWNEIEHLLPAGRSETLYTSESLGKVRRFKQLNDCLCCFVVHPRKAEYDKTTGKLKPATLNDCAGSVHFKNKADIGVSIYRDVQNIPDVSDPVVVSSEKVRFFFDGQRGMSSMNIQLSSRRYTEAGQRHEAVLIPEDVPQETGEEKPAWVASQFPAQAEASAVDSFNAVKSVNFHEPKKIDDDGAECPF